MIRNQKLTKVQREILVGILLGDAHLERPCRIKVEQGDKHKVYAQHLFDIFANFIQSSQLRKRVVSLGGAQRINWCFQTGRHSCFLFYAHQFYENKKRVPPLISRLLTPRGLAYWYMDDGSMKSKQSKGVIFNTQVLKRQEVSNLCRVLSTKFGLKSWPRRPRRSAANYQIYVSGESYDLLREIIYPYLIPEMLYKFPTPRKRGLRSTQLPKE